MKKLIPFLFALPALAQETIEQRLDRIERENRELRHRIDGLTGGGAAGSDGSGQAAAQDPDRIEMPTGFGKVYATDEGVSIGGYGEYIFTQRSGLTDVADALRTVLYVGYHFNDKWLLHTEIELEHGSTSSSSGTTSSSGEVSLEFGYLEYEACEYLALRVGMVLVPMGLINEQHEPTQYLPVARPQTETRIIPTTWRELGVEAVASFEDFDARAFVGTGLDGEEFDAAGLRGGRQKGNRQAADDIAVALRGDYHCAEGLLVGGSAFYQQTGQDGTSGGATAIPDMDTLIVEAHVDWRPGAWIVRALWASAFSDDAEAFAMATGNNLAERMDGGYAELGLDIAPWAFPDTEAAVIPFVRFEHIDTQAKMPDGLTADSAQDNRIFTVGLHVRPIEQIVFKVDYEDWDNSFDRFHIGMGYVF